MAYEVIKRVGGRAYRYRVESYRDPETRRVRGKWTYLGRVEGEGTLSPERQARPSSRTRLLDALERLLENHELGGISTGMVAQEAGLAYGTFYRYFKDLDHIVREAMLRRSTASERLREDLTSPTGSAGGERDKMIAWVRETVANAQSRPGLLRAWYVASNQDAAVVAERQSRFDAMVDCFAGYIEKLNAAGLAAVCAPRFNAYALVALITAVVRECAVERTFTDAKLDGILDVVVDLAGLPVRDARHAVVA
ncbi:MAG: TetR/AcrR family transcriptional regulator [Candidatus Velthaea sp.]